MDNSHSPSPSKTMRTTKLRGDSGATSDFAHPKELMQITNSDKKTDRVDAKELARIVRLNLAPESYVLTDEIREPARSYAGENTWSKTVPSTLTRHGLLSDHEITEDVKPLSGEGRELLQ